MRPFDFAPLHRSTIGFDQLAHMLDSIGGSEEVGYPPYNIERVAENAYRITMAIAGFAQADVKIETKDTTLIVVGDKKAETPERQFLHRGIAERGFERRFQLADHVEVTGADLRDGLLHIDLVRNLPERMKPRQIVIGTAPAAPQLEVKARV